MSRKLEKCISYEKKIDYETIIKEAIDNIITIKITNENNKYEDLL